MERRRAPDVSTPAAMARTIAVFYVVGGLAGFLVTWGAHAPPAAETALIGFSLTALCCAGVVHRWARSWPRWAFHAAMVLGALLIDGGVLASPDPATAVVTAALLTFVVVVGYLFFSFAVGTGYLVGGLVGVTAALLVQGDVPVPTMLALHAVVIALGTVIRGLVQRAAGASRDPLTDLKNRRGFDQDMQLVLATSQRVDDRLSAALLDLDGFKAVNDRMGHAAGDQVLRKVADVWARALPPGAVIARHGGDEFALLLPGFSGPDALRLVRELSARHPDIGVSVGVAQHTPGESAAQLLRRADQALYSAKAGGRGRSELSGGVASELVSELAAAVHAGELQIHFQPVTQLATDTVFGVEALARWDRPGKGSVPPQEFIALAEQHDLIGALGEHVLRTASSELAALYAATGHRLRLGVNVSGRELCDPGYPERVLAVLAETGWPLTETVLEVTETMLDAESVAAVTALYSLRSMGAVVAIDDFGTGYSSLSRLDTLPADILKLDSSFIATITTSPRRAVLLRSIVAMASTLGLDVVAEGVETPAQEAELHEAGCTYGQGWRYGRPAPLAEVVQRLGWDDAPVSPPAGDSAASLP